MGIAVILILTIGFFSGRIYSALQVRWSAPPIEFIPDINIRQPVIRLDVLTDGVLEGSVNLPTTRIIVDDTIALINEDKSFELDVSSIQQVKQIVVPAGMKFVASKKGKKYYPVDSKSGSRIKPENRVYFKTAGEAKKAGYKP